MSIRGSSAFGQHFLAFLGNRIAGRIANWLIVEGDLTSASIEFHLADTHIAAELRSTTTGAEAFGEVDANIDRQLIGQPDRCVRIVDIGGGNFSAPYIHARCEGNIRLRAMPDQTLAIALGDAHFGVRSVGWRTGKDRRPGGENKNSGSVHPIMMAGRA
jgi:hypothetical protein